MGRTGRAPRPRVAILVTAWDLLNAEEADAGPMEYLTREYPLFAGRIAHTESLDVAVFAVSVVGGDFADLQFRREFLADGEVARRGFVVTERSGRPEVVTDLTLPLEWVLSSEDGQ